jgi:hypothetical protein
MPFHYGRWLWQPPDGWLWIPDTRWAPAWDAWREGPGLVGWSPLPPLAPDGADLPSFWVFMPRRALTAADVEPFLLPVEETPRALALSAPVRELGDDQGHAWFVGPRPIDGEWTLTIHPPGPEELEPAMSRASPRPAPAPPRPPRARVLHGPLPTYGAPGLVPPLPPDLPN